MERMIADVERDENHAAERYHPPQLSHDRTKLRRFEMDHGVEGHGSGEACLWEVKREEVAHAEVEIGVQTGCTVDHLGREVDAQGIHALVVEVSSDVAGAAAEVSHPSLASYLFGKTVEEMAVEGFLRQFGGHVFGVRLGRRVVA